MSLFRLVFREILYRKLSFLLGVISVSVAVTGLVAALAVLQKHDARTGQIIAAKEAETKQQMAKLEDDYRRLMLKLGFNVLILPREQNLGDLYADDFASKYMPEEYATRLAKSRVATINHVLPSLQQKVNWPEYDRTVLLVGVRGEVYVQSPQQKPLLEAVKPGMMILGSELANNLALKVGTQAKLMGRQFTVGKVNPARGNKDDITVWISLSEAQEMLDKPGLINGILALDCTCDTVDRLGRIRPEIASILPDTQVIEYASQSLTRAEARQRAAGEAQASIQREKEGRDKLRAERAALAAVLVPGLMLASGIWIGLLALTNVRDRRGEIGIFRALGLSGQRILIIFLTKAFIMGLAGACLGYLMGRTAGVMWHDTPGVPPIPMAFVDLKLLGVMLVGAPLLAALASWLPALHAAQQDPAAVLREM